MTAQTDEGKGQAIASLILGILALIVSFTGAGSGIGLILAIIGYCLGKNALKKRPGEGMAKAGVICSLITIVIALIMLVFMGGLMAIFSSVR